MSASTDSAHYRSDPNVCAFFQNSAGRARWSALNITLMVLGFIFFWPVGLVILFWIMSGRDAVDLPSAIKQKWNNHRSQHHRPHAKNGGSENEVFNEYQQTQRDRIREIEEEIATREKRFQEFRANAARRKDRAEFDDFMASNPIEQ